jgi:ferrous iron transport protein A
MKCLNDLAIGHTARVRAVHGDDELTARLLEMGLIPGVEVTTIGRAPLGDPLEFELRGYRLSVRKSEAARVELDS